MRERLETEDSTWSKNILNHWSTLPPTLLKVIFRAVKECEDKSPFEILALEKKLNSKWRQTEDYKEWLRSGSQWNDTDVEFYFADLELPEISDEPAIFEAVQELEDDSAPVVCPVTGMKSSSSSACPASSGKDASALNVCPVTGQTGTVENTDGFQASPSTCPVSGQVNSEVGIEKCPYISGQKQQENTAVCPVTGGKSSSTSFGEGCPFSKQNQIDTASPLEA